MSEGRKRNFGGGEREIFWWRKKERNQEIKIKFRLWDFFGE